MPALRALAPFPKKSLKLSRCGDLLRDFLSSDFVGFWLRMQATPPLTRFVVAFSIVAFA
jgi:hypothetical protein